MLEQYYQILFIYRTIEKLAIKGEANTDNSWDELLAMADQLQTQIYSENWWSSARNISTLGLTSVSNDVIGFGWQNEIEMKARAFEDSVSVSFDSMVYQNTQKPEESDSVAGESESEDLMDSTLRFMVYSLLSPTTADCNQGLVGRSSELNLSGILQQDSSPKLILHTEKDWSPENYSDEGELPSATPFKGSNEVFIFEQDGLESSKKSDYSRVDYPDVPMDYPTVSASMFLPDLYEPDPPSQPPPCYYSSPIDYHMDLNETSPKLQSNTNKLHFSNNTPYLNAPSEVRSSISSSLQTSYPTPTIKENPIFSNFAQKINNEQVCDSSSVIKKSSEITFKRPRIETPSSLPTFKVRKEKLGDRVTALQQLVSPFGKTDTASVLFEAIEYIKFLHDQVGVLSSPYMKNAILNKQNSDQLKNIEALKQDLRSRGLCLVPVSSTFSITNEITTEFWTPTFGVAGSYK